MVFIITYNLILKQAYKLFFSDKSLLVSTLISIAFLTFSFFVNSFAGRYADEKGTNYVTDIVLSNTRVYDVDGIFTYGIIAFFAFIIIWCFRYPAQTPYIIKSIAVFVLVRSVFVSLTHLGPFPTHAIINSNNIIGRIVGEVNFWADLFFSGHTGLPLLMALIFWNHKWLRYTFIFASIFFGVIVLLWHLHYSIDVLAAFFITYTINHICELLWKKDKMFFESHHSIIYPQKNL